MKTISAGRAFRLLLSAIAISAVTGCGGSISTGSPPHLSILNTLSLPVGFQGSGLAVEGSLAYVSTEAIGAASGPRSLVIVSLANPAAPALLSVASSGLKSDMAGIVVSGTHAYVPFGSASGTNFQIWDVSNPRNPTVVGATNIACPAGMYPFQNPALYGGYVYVSCWESEVTTTGAFAIVDVSAPSAPSVAGSVAVTATYQPISFAIWEQNLYVVATQGGSTSDYVLLYSLKDPASPSILAKESVPHSPQWVAALGTLALAPIYDGSELEVVDFSIPSSPHGNSVNLGSCRPMRVAIYQANLALVTCDGPDGGLAEVGISTAGHPTYLGTALSGTVFNDLAPSGSYVYGADTSGNFETIGQKDSGQ